MTATEAPVLAPPRAGASLLSNIRHMGVHMADQVDIAEIDPVLELTLGLRSLTCSGTLNFSTRRHVLEATGLVLEGKPSGIGIDVSGLQVTDADGANALVVMQKMVRDAGVSLHWRGLDEHVLAVLP